MWAKQNKRCDRGERFNNPNFLHLRDFLTRNGRKFQALWENKRKFQALWENYRQISGTMVTEER